MLTVVILISFAVYIGANGDAIKEILFLFYSSIFEILHSGKKTNFPSDMKFTFYYSQTFKFFLSCKSKSFFQGNEIFWKTKPYLATTALQSLIFVQKQFPSDIILPRKSVTTKWGHNGFIPCTHMVITLLIAVL